MARLQIDLPETFSYSTRLQVRLSELGGGLHLGNHMLVAYLNEAFFHFLREHGFSGYIEKPGFINPEFSVLVTAETLYGESLRVDLALFENGPYGFDLIFRLVKESSGKEAARAKMTMLFFDYDQRRLERVPETFKAFLQKPAAVPL
ncbi:MAG: thioesterase family protein [Desulfuromonadales bacterium]|nr:thioesterase family protein [Desulfuromonadales bacterium]